VRKMADRAASNTYRVDPQLTAARSSCILIPSISPPSMSDGRNHLGKPPYFSRADKHIAVERLSPKIPNRPKLLPLSTTWPFCG